MTARAHGARAGVGRADDEATDKTITEMTAGLSHRRREMYLLYEDLARAHMRERLAEAEDMRRAARLVHARRAQRRAEAAVRRARRALAHVALVR